MGDIQKMKISLIAPKSNGKDGIGTYCEELNQVLGREIETSRIGFPSGTQALLDLLRASAQGITDNSKIVHLQYEYGLFGPKSLYSFIIIPLLYLGTRVYKKKFIITLHEVLNSNSVEGSNYYLKRYYLVVLNHILVYFSDHIILLSDVAEDRLTKCTSTKSYSVLTHGSNAHSSLTVSKQEAKVELGYTPDDPVVVEPGYIEPRKGCDIVSKVASNLPDVSFVLAGGKKETYSEYYNNILDESPDNLEITGTLPMPKFLQYIRAADIALLPYQTAVQGGIRNRVTQSGVFNQCAAQSTPVIASDNQYFNQINSEFGCIITVNSSDPREIENEIKSLLADPDRQSRLGENIFEYSQSNSMEEVAKDHVEIYMSTV
ncbi:glycosyltransferase [Haloferax prahovense]|uniref:glycosyltransferase n=1 Tax=Haloferax prahovense TaxID=381852 RepID=UPI003C761FE6